MGAEKKHILLIEENPDDAALIELELQKSGLDFVVVRVETAEAFMEALQFKKWDVIICDYNLPGFDGLKALEMLKKIEHEIPFILVSGTTGAECAVEAVLAGANDYVMKDNLKRLPVSVKREIRNQEHRDEKKRLDEEIRESLREKEVLLREIHHRVKNNLAVISALLTLQVEHVKDEQSRQFFQDSVGRIKSIALIHEKLYQSELLAKVPMGEYLRGLVLSIQDMYCNVKNEIALHLETDDYSIDITKAIPCGLIVNELLTNAYKHAFKGRKEGNIYLKLSRNTEKDLFTIEVSDDGSGLPGGEKSFDDNTSLGFTIIRGLAKQLAAELDVHSNFGTSVRLKFKA